MKQIVLLQRDRTAKITDMKGKNKRGLGQTQFTCRKRSTYVPGTQNSTASCSNFNREGGPTLVGEDLSLPLLINQGLTNEHE